MDDEFEIPVVFDNKQYHFMARLLMPGAYTHEERKYRAYIDTEKYSIDKVDKQLLQEIAFALAV